MRQVACHVREVACHIRKVPQVTPVGFEPTQPKPCELELLLPRGTFLIWRTACLIWYDTCLTWHAACLTLPNMARHLPNMVRIPLVTPHKYRCVGSNPNGDTS